MDSLQFIYVVSSFLFQIVLIVHFALRKWRFEFAIQHGWIVYLLGVPAGIASIILLIGGQAWYFWLAGILYLAWAAFGYFVEYARKIEWRNPIRWPVFGPYLLLYLATVMFYWFPLTRINRPLWYGYAVLFVISTVLNISSHKNPAT